MLHVNMLGTRPKARVNMAEDRERYFVTATRDLPVALDTPSGLKPVFLPFTYVSTESDTGSKMVEE